MKLYVIDNGKMWIERSGLLAEEGQSADGDLTPCAEWVDIPVGTFLIDHPEGLVVFDTACDPEGMSKNWPEYNKQVSPHEATEEDYLPARLKQVGVSPDDVKYVVLSHLHTDHVGCLKLFKNAEIFVNETEFKEALRQYATRKMEPAYIATDIKGWLEAGLNWHLVADGKTEYPLLRGLTILNFGPGHAYGMMGLLVELQASGNFLLVSDALYSPENLGPPVRLPGLVYDPLGYDATAKFIRNYAEKKNARILFGHDKTQFDSLEKSPDGFYQ